MLGGCGCFLSTEGWVVGLWSCSREAFKQADSVPGVAIEIGSAARGGEPLCLGSATAWFQCELALQGNMICHFLSLGGQRRSDSSCGHHQRPGSNFSWVSAWLQQSDPVCLLCCLGESLPTCVLLFHILENLFHLFSNSS